MGHGAAAAADSKAAATAQPHTKACHTAPARYAPMSRYIAANSAGQLTLHGDSPLMRGHTLKPYAVTSPFL